MYPASELRAAAAAARAAGIDLPGGYDGDGTTVRVLERHGFLPRDRARVDALVDRVTAQARVRVDAARRARGTWQTELPLWSGRYPDDEPEQLALAL